MKLLVPVNGSKASLAAVRHAASASKGGRGELILLNVQPLLPAYVARFSTKASRDAMRAERSAAALREARALAEAMGISYQVATAAGHTAQVIADEADRLGVDQIVLGTARRAGWWQALLSPVARVIEQANVPVAVVGAGRSGPLERYGVPACIGVGLTAWVIAGE